jgi:hypothetical protein
MRALLLSLVVGLGSLGLTLGTPTQTRAAVPPVVYTSSFQPVAWHGWHRGWYGRGYYRPFYRGYYGRGYYGGYRGYYRPYWGGYYGGWGYPGYSSYYYGGYPYGGISTPWFSLWW